MAVLRKKSTRDGFIYEVDFRFGGQRYRKSTGTSDRKFAMRVLDEVRGRIASGKFKLEDLEQKNQTLEGLKPEYVERYATKHKAPRSINIDRQVMDDMIAKFGARRVIRTITTTDAEDFQTWLLNEKVVQEAVHDEKGKVVTPAIIGNKPVTVNIKLRTLKAIFNWAKKDEQKYVDKNPFVGVREIKVDKHANLTMTPEEVQALFAEADKDTRRGAGRKFKQFMMFLLITACRRTEAVRLRWYQVDFRMRSVTFMKTKGKVDRVIPVNDELMEVLLQIKADHPNDGPNDRLFVYAVDDPTKKFLVYKEQAGLRKELHLHCFRHTAAHNMMEHNVHLMLIKDSLGHADVKTTEIYLRSFPNALKSAYAATSIKEFIGSAKPGESETKQQGPSPSI